MDASDLQFPRLFRGGGGGEGGVGWPHVCVYEGEGTVVESNYRLEKRRFGFASHMTPR
jgi:hypothetical protein